MQLIYYLLLLFLAFLCDFIMYKIEVFGAILGQHVSKPYRSNFSIDDIEQTINREAAAPYIRGQVDFSRSFLNVTSICSILVCLSTYLATYHL